MTSISELRHKLILCKQEDVVLSGGEFKLIRSEVRSVWASVKEKAGSAFSSHGAVMKDSKNIRTHVVVMRYSTQYNLSSMAWLYEARTKSSPRWFKILSIGQTEDGGQPFFKVDCRLIERSDEAAEPQQQQSQSPVIGLPTGVKL